MRQVLFAALVVVAAPAHAQAPPPAEVVPAPAVAAKAVVTAPAPATSDRGAFVVGLKAGGVFAEPFSPLGASFLVDVELGYVAPWLHRSFGVLVDLGYTQPTASGTQTDPRVDANQGSYAWNLTQRELVLGVTAMYRATFIARGDVVPYIGVGPRLWFLETLVDGGAGPSPIARSTEQSTKVGVSVPIGVDVALGPGRIFGEAQLLWAPIDHRTTGDASVGALTLDVGYRLFL